MSFIPPYGKLCERCRLFFFDEETHRKACSREIAETAVRLTGRPLRFYIVAKILGVSLAPDDGFAPMWFVLSYDLLNDRDHEFYCVCSSLPMTARIRRRPLLVALLREAIQVRGGTDP